MNPVTLNKAVLFELSLVAVRPSCSCVFHMSERKEGNPRAPHPPRDSGIGDRTFEPEAVSYTHLTLPTILRV